MKKYILSLLVLMISVTTVLAQAPNTQSEFNKLDVNGKRSGYWKISALLKKLGPPWAPAEIVEEGNYAASMKTGMWIEYYQGGAKKSELTFVNNRPNGPAKTYFENGKLEAEGNWVGSRWTGPYTLYYDNGNVRQKFNYNAMGVRDGAQTYYHPNGVKAIEINMVAGKENGVGKEYNTNGELVKETYSVNGVMDASKTVVYEPKKAEDPNAIKAPEEIVNEKKKAPRVDPVTGQKSKEGVFDGDGFWILVDKNENITLKGTFKNYQLIEGEERIYNEAGFCIRVKVFANGKYKGEGIVPKENTKN